MSRAASLVAVAVLPLASAAQAQVLTVALKPLAAAPVEQQTTTVLKGGAICIRQGPLTGSEMRHALTSGDSDTRLREELTRAGMMVNASGAASVEVSGVARVSLMDVCLPNWGFGNKNNIGGKVEVAVEWTLTDRATGAEIGRLSTRESLERQTGPGELAGMVAEAFAANARVLAANTALRQAAARPAPASSRFDASAPPDPALRVVAPWRQTTQKTPLAIATPQIVDSDLDLFDGGMEYFAVQVEAGETLRLELLDASKPIVLMVKDARGRFVAMTDVKNPERQLSAPIAQSGTYLVNTWSKDYPLIASYRLKIDTDRRPYKKPEPPPPPAPIPAPAISTQAPKGAGTKPGAPAPKPAVAAVPPPLPKFTPPPGVLAAEIGRSVTRPAGKVGAAIDLFAFIGEAGAVLQASAVGAGGKSLTLYTPDGAEILKADGVDQAKLTAVLPLDGIYLLSVGRQDAAKPYKLSLAAEAPDIFQWAMRYTAGYEVLGPNGSPFFWTCWSAPGSTLRYNFPDGRWAAQTVQRGGGGRWEFSGPAKSYSFTTQLAAGVFIRTSDAGEVQSWSMDEAIKLGAYQGYLCR